MFLENPKCLPFQGDKEACKMNISVYYESKGICKETIDVTINTELETVYSRNEIKQC